MPNALIGCSGFVGSNLYNQLEFDHLYNSKNIMEICGKEFGDVYCAGVRAEKWLANNQPETDWEQIQSLIDPLKTIKARRFILISTIDVYGYPVNVREDTEIDIENQTAYGKNRLLLETFVNKQFASHLIVRLPGLVGDGLKKNFIYDLLNRIPKFITERKFLELLEKGTDEKTRSILANCYWLDKKKNYQLKDDLDGLTMEALDQVLNTLGFTSWVFTHRDSRFQFYHLKYLAKDIEIALNNSIELINFATEPLLVSDIAMDCCGVEFDNVTANPPLHYDMKTKYDDLYQGKNGYFYDRESVLSDIKVFIQKNRSKGS